MVSGPEVEEDECGRWAGAPQGGAVWGPAAGATTSPHPQAPCWHPACFLPGTWVGTQTLVLDPMLILESRDCWVTTRQPCLMLVSGSPHWTVDPPCPQPLAQTGGSVAIRRAGCWPLASRSLVGAICVMWSWHRSKGIGSLGHASSETDVDAGPGGSRWAPSRPGPWSVAVSGRLPSLAHFPASLVSAVA